MTAKKEITPRVPTYPCGNCGTLIWKAKALRQDGYCDPCEFMKTVDVLKRLMVGRHTLDRMASRGELRKVKIPERTVLWHRVDVEGMRDRMIRDRRGYIGVTHPQSA